MRLVMFSVLMVLASVLLVALSLVYIPATWLLGSLMRLEQWAQIKLMLERKS